MSLLMSEEAVNTKGKRDITLNSNYKLRQKFAVRRLESEGLVYLTVYLLKTLAFASFYSNKSTILRNLAKFPNWFIYFLKINNTE